MDTSRTRSFFDPQAWPFLETLAAGFPDLAREAREASGRLVALQWLQAARFAAPNPGLEGRRATFYLHYAGAPIEANRRLAPAIAAAIDRVPGLTTAGLYFLGPHSRILPHKGVYSDIMRAHLGLIVPPGCFLRIEDETRSWEEGRWLVFDDTPEHEAWNESDQWRCVLLLDFYHQGDPDTAARQAELRTLRGWVFHPGYADSAWFAAAGTRVPEEEKPALMERFLALPEGERQALVDLVDTYGLFVPR